MKTGKTCIECKKGLFLGDITPSLLEAAVDEKWFDDHDTNRLLGFGKGVGGSVEFRKGFQDFIHGSDNVTPMGVYYRGKPLGICGIQVVSNKHRTGKLYIFLPRHNRLYNASRSAVFALCDTFFESGGYRLEVEILRINKAAVSFFRKFGFTQETIKKSSFWMEKNVYDTVSLRLLRSDWRK